MIVTVDYNICDQCGTCISVCKTNSIRLEDKLYIDNTSCSLCSICVKICPFGALSIDKSKKNEKIQRVSEKSNE